jgi:misacylated tRNA(Ala) deacylase
MVMTDLLYLDDSYLRSFDATVTGTSDGVVILDRTAFYPTGGGQPHDLGTLRAGETTWRVVGVARSGADVLHHLEPGAAPPPVGAVVCGELDWDRRYRLMRTHSALHVLCGVVFREYGALVTGGNMDVDKARMDFELDDLSAERVTRIAQAANEQIRRGLSITWRQLPRDEAFRIPDLIRTRINLLPEGIARVRVVEIDGLDLQADGGTHVHNTAEIGGLRVIGTRSKGRINKRLEIELTDAAVSTIGAGA